MTTAQVTLETGLGLTHRGVAAIVFQPLGTADFQSIVKDTQELLTSSARDTGTVVETADDEFGYRWLILRDQDFEDLVVSLNTVSTELQGGGYGDRLLAAVFAFEEEGRPVYFIYNFKRGRVLPVRPQGEQGARQRARAAAQGPDGRGAALRGGHVPLVPAVGDPALASRGSGLTAGAGLPESASV